MALKFSRRNTLCMSIGVLFPSFSSAMSPRKRKGKVENHSLYKPSLKSAYPKARVKAPAIIGKAQPSLPSIVLDPGHGGKDPGAIGYSGTYEKHVAYATAVELASQLNRSGRYKVYLTRNSDHFIPLDGRVEFAQKRKANLFISMHADALKNSSVRGASVYTLSNHASDAQSAALASVENQADRYGGPNIHVTSPEVEKILASLVTLETKKESATIAQNVVLSFNARVGLLPNPKRHAAFVVLKSVNIPSILVEMGFMSNRKDEAALRQVAYRRLIAMSMMHAVDRYFTIGGSVTHLTG